VSVLTLLVDRLQDEEGKKVRNGRHVVYQDSKGVWTAGYGRNMQDRGLSEGEARLLLANDAADVVVDLAQNWEPWVYLDDVRKVVIGDLYFNMRLGRPAAFVEEFKATLDLVADKKFSEAADHMRAWKWYGDVGPRRADPLIAAMRTGAFV
jgi:lysozyme